MIWDANAPSVSRLPAGRSDLARDGAAALGKGIAMRCSTYSHCEGAERVPPPIQGGVSEAIGAVEAKCERGAVRAIRSELLRGLLERGWSGEVPVARGSDMTITAIQSGVGLCLQTGNKARVYADLMKLQTLYLDGSIIAAIVIVPSQPAALALGDNIAQ